MKPVSESLPKGAICESTFEGFRIECSTRSAQAFFLVPFTLAWAGISLGGIYGRQLTSSAFNLGESLFGIPFVIGSFFLIGKTLSSIFGVVRFELKGDTLYYFSGLQPLGKRQQIDWRSLQSAREEIASSGNGEHTSHVIYLEGSQRHVVGHSLSAAHRYFVVGVLNEQLQKKEGSRHTGSGR